jgi:hypothetical protein
MKFNVFNKKQEHVSVTVNMEVGAEGELQLFACNESGEPIYWGYILKLTPDGKLRRFTCNIPGIQTDDHGKILIDECQENIH